ncbi:MAG: 1-(5-phosphoribosyl)-5-[(5-phosphoribosylamino)methylideneamino]imidazole-4-carboxamide isomerase [Vitreimonas sp.]
MLIMPAIDLLGGACVRLSQGRFDAATKYGDDPLDLAAAFAAAGADWVHVVDLDGAREGRPVQHAALRRIARNSKIKIQCGGGVRQWGDVSALIDAGVARVAVGSAAVERADEVRHWIESFGIERVCCAFDVRPGGAGFEVTVRGWTAATGQALEQAFDRYPPGVLKHALVTDVSRDGVLGGANVELATQIRAMRPDIALQASGGVASLDDIDALRRAGASAAIVGRAFYERRFSLEDALAR